MTFQEVATGILLGIAFMIAIVAMLAAWWLG